MLAWEDRGSSKGGLHEWRVRLPVPVGRRLYARVYLFLASGKVQAVMPSGYIRSHYTSVDEAKAAVEARINGKD